MAYPPTPEQQACIDTFRWGVDMKIDAYAGAGKTSTLKLLAATTDDQGAYLAYNSAIAAEARGSFPSTVDARTVHAHAFRWATAEWGDALGYRLNGPRQKANETAQILGIGGPHKVGDKYLGPAQVARLAMETVERYCYTGDLDVLAKHVPTRPGLEHHRDDLAEQVLPYARKAWADLCTKSGELRATHDSYLKRWINTQPTIQTDYLLLDEAQDTNGAVLALVESHRGKAQIIAVGDRYQSLYAWRGSTNAMEVLPVDDDAYSLNLTRSWRFGEQVAGEANKWLRLLGAKVPLQGNPHIDTRIAPLAKPEAVLCRSNAEAVSQLMDFQERSVSCCIVGEGRDFKKIAEAALELKRGRRPWHPELAAFESWFQLVEYVEQAPDGGDLKVAVNLIDTHGAAEIIKAIDNQSPSGYAEVTISTAHKAKGLEWDTVKIAEDFRKPNDDEDGRPVLPSRDEMMLAYVAVTRARKVLDPAGLEWVNDLVAHLNAGTKFGARPGEKNARPARTRADGDLIDAVRREIHKNTTALLPEEARQGGRVR